MEARQYVCSFRPTSPAGQAVFEEVERNAEKSIAAIRAAKTFDELIDGLAMALSMTGDELRREAAEAWLAQVIEKAEAKDFKPTGERREVGKFDADVLAFLKARGVTLATDVITISDRDIMHALRTAKVEPLPASVWKRLPSLLAKPVAVYWDKQKPGILFALNEPEGKGKILVLVNYWIKTASGKKQNNVAHTGRLLENLDEFENRGRYVRIR